MSSSFDALFEALKNSGMDMGGFGQQGGGSASDSAASAGAGAGSSAGGSGSGGSNASSGKGPSFADFFTGRGNGGGDKGKKPFYEVESSFFDNLQSMGKKALIISSIVLIIVLLCAYWWFHPPINIHSVDTWLFVAIFILFPLFIFFRAKSHKFTKGNAKTTPSEGKAKAFKWASWLPVAVVVVGLLGGLASFSFFPGNAAKYANVLKTETYDYAQDIQQVDYSEIPIIDRDSAALLGNRAMGEIPEYVSQFEISSMYSQINYKNTPVRVSPLGYADLFKWLTNRDSGIPAYVLVDMTTQNAQIVKLDSNPIYYSQSEPLARNIDRYVQLKYPFYMFDEISFEIDEDGQPWWICPVQTRTIGLFGGTTIDRVVMVNATTGECTDLAIGEVPEWVDRAYPADLLIEQYNWSGAYQDGWFNSWLGQKNVVQTTPGTDGNAGYNYIAKDDDVWVYTGVTSATADNSIVGFVLINQRTAESHYYAVAGATETSAMGSAEGAVQNLRYDATFPLLINVSGQPTYFMALKDSAGTVKKFAMVDIEHYQNVATGDTVADTQKSYQSLLATSGVLSSDVAADDLQKASGTIRSMAQAVIDSNSHYYVTLEDSSAIYDFVLPGQIEIVGYSVGDDIGFTYIEGEPTNTVQEITSTLKASKVSNVSETSSSE